MSVCLVCEIQRVSNALIVLGLFNYLSRHQNLLVLNVKRRSIPARVIRPQDLTLEAENIKALKLICLVSGSKLGRTLQWSLRNSIFFNHLSIK